MPKKGSVTAMARAFPLKPLRAPAVEPSCLRRKPIRDASFYPIRFPRRESIRMAITHVRETGPGANTGRSAAGPVA